MIVNLRYQGQIVRRLTVANGLNLGSPGRSHPTKYGGNEYGGLPVLVAEKTCGQFRQSRSYRSLAWQSPSPFAVDVPAVHNLHQCHDSSGINEGHQPTARAAFADGKPRVQKLLEPLDLQLITPEIERHNRLASLKSRSEI